MQLNTTSPRQTPTAAILVIGNEVLSGKIVDTNSPFLLKELYALGVKVMRVHVIPDELGVIADEVSRASAAYDYVFTSGGVGPTHDDVTFQGVARAFGIELEERQEVIDLLNLHYRGRVTPAARRMALLPQGTELLACPGQPHPVTVVRNVYVFPGVPEMFRCKFDAIRERFRDDPFYLVRIFTQQGESVLAAHLEQTLEHFEGIEIGSYPRFDTPEYRVLITLESKNRGVLEGAARHLLAGLESERLVRVEGLSKS